MPGRAFGYIRVSRSFQAKGTSLEEQTEAIKRYFDYQFRDSGVEWAAPLVDKSSGKKSIANRPQGSQITQKLTRGDHLIVSKLDRAFRNARDALTQVEIWDQLGITVHLLDVNVNMATAAGRMFFTVMAAMAEFETNRRRERWMENQAHALARGLAFNHPKVLWKRVVVNGEKRFVINEHHRAIAQKIVEWRVRGWSFRQIVQHLREHNVRRSDGRYWTFNVVTMAYRLERWLQQKEQENGGVLPKCIMPPQGRIW